ncbi:GL24899 [Drosophila persimilis]|uniref:GL24899 n=1 Tax=Drosophila persimilis TaxID=7234 RepID=B4GUA4_DROPE|nr:GL24899 [Drosophila persimilis]
MSRQDTSSSLSGVGPRSAEGAAATTTLSPATATEAAATGSKISTSTPQKGDDQEKEFINRSMASEIDASDALAISLSVDSSGSTASTMSGSPVAKRQLSTANLSRIRPQSSYSARVLILTIRSEQLPQQLLSSRPPAIAA